jgi:hypothetical protein
MDVCISFLFLFYQLQLSSVAFSLPGYDYPSRTIIRPSSISILMTVLRSEKPIEETIIGNNGPTDGSGSKLRAL